VKKLSSLTRAGYVKDASVFRPSVVVSALPGHLPNFLNVWKSHGSLATLPLEGCTPICAFCDRSRDRSPGAIHRSSADYASGGGFLSGRTAGKCASVGTAAVRSRAGTGIVGRAASVAGAETLTATGEDAPAVHRLARG